MSGDPVPAKSRRIGLTRFTAVVLFAFLFLPVHLHGQTASPNAVQAGILADLHSDRRVVQNGRWFLVREFTVDFAVPSARQTYCGEISTTDATEAHDLIDSSGQPVEVIAKGKDLHVKLKDGRQVKAQRLGPDKCARG